MKDYLYVAKQVDLAKRLYASGKPHTAIVEFVLNETADLIIQQGKEIERLSKGEISSGLDEHEENCHICNKWGESLQLRKPPEGTFRAVPAVNLDTGEAHTLSMRNDVLETIRLKFASSNNVDVERITLNRKEVFEEN